MPFFKSLGEDAGVRHIVSRVKGNAELYASRGQALREQGCAPLLAAFPPAKP